MALPWVAAIAVEYLVLRWLFRKDLAVRPEPRDTPEPDMPVFVLVVLALTLAGFAITSLLGLSPAWAALAGATVLALRAIARRETTAKRIVAAVDIPFLTFVLCLGVVVNAVMLHGLDEAMRSVLPSGQSLPALLGIAAVAAVLSNLVNNLPAVLVLLPLVATSGPAAVLAVLLGVNIGPNLTYVGSLANLLWRGAVRRDMQTSFGEFSRIGLCTVPLTLGVSVVGLWLGIQVLGV
jgi:arsenical pump membrane protein